MGIWVCESGDLGMAPISPKSPKNSILSTIFERYDGIVTKEQLTSDEFFKKLREKIIPIEKANHPDRYLKCDYSGIDKKIKHFLRELTDQDSYFDLFGFSSLPENDVMRLAELFVCRPDHLHDIYKQIKSLNITEYDFKGLIYSDVYYDLDTRKSEDIYADYKSLVFNSECFEDCNCISDHAKYRIWRARSITLDLYSITKEFNLFDTTKRINAINWIKYFNEIFYNDIIMFEDEEQDQYGMNKELSIELYMDFIETIVRLSLMYYVPAYVGSAIDESTRPILDNAYKIVLERTEIIKDNISLLLQGIITINDDGSKSVNRKIRKEQNTISFDDQIKRFVYFLERISKYNVAVETMLVLKEEKEDKSNYIDVGGFTIKLIKKYQGKKFNTVQKDKSNKCEGKAFTLEKLIKERETLGLRKVLYSSQKNVAKDLLVNAKKEHNNGLLYCSQMTTLYRELFVRRKASKHTKESANKIIYNLYTTNYDRKSYYNLLLGYPATPSPYDLFKAKRKYRRQLDFLDQKFIRGYFFDKEVKDEYDYYIKITKNIYMILLYVYLFLDYDIMFSTLRNIAEWFVDVLPFDPNQQDPEPIIILETTNKDGIKREEVYKIPIKKKNASITKHPRGRTRKITPDDDKKIEELIASNNKITIKKIIEELSLEVTEETVRQHIMKMGYQYDRKIGYAKKTYE